MICCTLYPTAKFYSKVASLLVSEHSNLADTKGSGYDSWVIGLRNKFKNERRKLSNNEVVEQSRAKYGVKRNVAKDTASTTTMQRNNISRLPDNAHGTSDTSDTSQHESWLSNEYLKQKPDISQMLVHLRESFQGRSKKMKTAKVLDCTMEYPYVMDFRMFMHEFELLTQKDAVKGVEDAVYKVLHIVATKDVRCSEEIKNSILNLDRFQGYRRRKRHLQALLVARALAEMFKEKRAMGSLFAHESAENVPATPYISYTGTSL
ncbi:uncharacterized protein LOC135374093 [Ornithodoros turicata]|uniref:uncharacterized protein LOC135374093 n=1 Tax=Ornithodoros turicata TaxID=34597 RepID=UPI00313945B5